MPAISPGGETTLWLCWMDMILNQLLITYPYSSILVYWSLSSAKLLYAENKTFLTCEVIARSLWKDFVYFYIKDLISPFCTNPIRNKAWTDFIVAIMFTYVWQQSFVLISRLAFHTTMYSLVTHVASYSYLLTFISLLAKKRDDDTLQCFLYDK